MSHKLPFEYRCIAERGECTDQTMLVDPVRFWRFIAQINKPIRMRYRHHEGEDGIGGDTIYEIRAVDGRRGDDIIAFPSGIGTTSCR